MFNIKYSELKKVKDFKEEFMGLVKTITVDEFMGFSTLTVIANEGKDGTAEIEILDQYTMSGTSEPKICTCSRMLGIVERRLTGLFDENNLVYERTADI